MPAVTSPDPPKARRPKTDCNTNEISKRMSPRRPWRLAEDGYPEPTTLEIAEGKAYKAFKLSGQEEKGEKGEAWKLLHIRLFREEGDPSVSRCPWCYTLRFGRPITVACGHCGTMKEIGE